MLNEISVRKREIVGYKFEKFNSFVLFLDIINIIMGGSEVYNQKNIFSTESKIFMKYCN